MLLTTPPFPIPCSAGCCAIRPKSWYSSALIPLVPPCDASSPLSVFRGPNWRIPRTPRGRQPASPRSPFVERTVLFDCSIIRALIPGCTLMPTLAALRLDSGFLQAPFPPSVKACQRLMVATLDGWRAKHNLSSFGP